MTYKHDDPKHPFLFGEEPCPRCLEFRRSGGSLRREAIQPLYQNRAVNALAVDGSGPCCRDCEAADSVVRRGLLKEWGMARVAVANDRQEQLRLPGVPMGLHLEGITRASVAGELELHHDWLAKVVPE